MDVFVALRVIQPDGTELMYANDPREPMTSGSLKVSHRVTDRGARPPAALAYPPRGRRPAAVLGARSSRSRSRSWGSRPGLPAGGQLRLDIHPIERNGDPLGGGEGYQRAYDHSYHDAARNRVHTGPAFPSQLVVPVMPAAG